MSKKFLQKIKMEAAEAVIYVKGQLYNIALIGLRPDPNQPRKFIDPAALEELTASIRQHGVLEPILFRQDTDGALYIIAGERRFAAAQNTGLAVFSNSGYLYRRQPCYFPYWYQFAFKC
jgi:hypothetical protein